MDGAGRGYLYSVIVMALVIIIGIVVIGSVSYYMYHWISGPVIDFVSGCLAN